MRNLIKKILREETSVNPKKDKVKALLFKMIDNVFEGADIYMYDDNIWAIFTDDMRWCFEIQYGGTLLYNYRFFDDIFKYFSMDVTDNQHYITEWVENTIQIPYYSLPLRDTSRGGHFRMLEVEDVIRIGEKLNKIKDVQTEESDDEIDEYARTLKNARKQGRGLKFSKSAIKSNPSRFRPYNREMVDESDPKTGTGKKPEGSSRRLYTDENPKDTVSVKFRTKEDIARVSLPHWKKEKDRGYKEKMLSPEVGYDESFLKFFPPNFEINPTSFPIKSGMKYPDFIDHFNNKVLLFYRERIFSATEPMFSSVAENTIFIDDFRLNFTFTQIMQKSCFTQF